MAALTERHLAELRFSEVRRAVQALSALYVEKRGDRLQAGAAFESTGKRAAYALYFTPLHFLSVRHVVRHCGAAVRPPANLIDLGCGTGAAAAAWGLECTPRPRITGIDRSGWALAEADWNWRSLRLKARTMRAGAEDAKLDAEGIVAAYAINELTAEARSRLLPRLLAAAAGGSAILIVEPVARRVAPWWPEWSRAFQQIGAADRDWRFAANLPPFLADMDRASSLNHRELTARSLWWPGSTR